MQHVLIIEDVAETREWLKSMATAAFSGCTTVLVGGVRAALAELARTKPDVALIDIGPPDGSGIDLLRNLRRSPAGSWSISG